jgi:hypothetical protein
LADALLFLGEGGITVFPFSDAADVVAWRAVTSLGGTMRDDSNCAGGGSSSETPDESLRNVGRM